MEVSMISPPFFNTVILFGRVISSFSREVSSFRIGWQFIIIKFILNINRKTSHFSVIGIHSWRVEWLDIFKEVWISICWLYSFFIWEKDLFIIFKFFIGHYGFVNHSLFLSDSQREHIFYALNVCRIFS